MINSNVHDATLSLLYKAHQDLDLEPEAGVVLQGAVEPPVETAVRVLDQHVRHEGTRGDPLGDEGRARPRLLQGVDFDGGGVVVGILYPGTEWGGAEWSTE